MIATDGLYFGEHIVLICDAKCSKAWGINNRPRVKLSDDDDDWEWLADDELGEAPVDPGTYEGDQAKPTCPAERLNKWCARECERSEIVDPNQEFALKDLSNRFRNIKHEPMEGD